MMDTETPLNDKPLSIARYPAPVLQRRGCNVEPDDLELPELVSRMLASLKAHHGVGLAGPQVNRSIRLFVAFYPEQMEKPQAYVNPELFAPEGEKTDEEGCLSLPGIRMPVRRAESISIRAHDLSGKIIETRADGLLARIWQHEMDHLNGILLIDYMSTVSRLANRKILKQLQREYLP